MIWIDKEFPNARIFGYKITSNPSSKYNCIAWAAGDSTAWWTYLPGYKWSDTVKREPSVERLIEVFNEMGYKKCNTDSLEEGYEKIAIYANSGVWTHAARQLANGHWTSKLGYEEDIEHSTPDALTNSDYGIVYCIMKKERK
jgi:hypothetical protein